MKDQVPEEENDGFDNPHAGSLARFTPPLETYNSWSPRV
jgi:hypothetical protein